MLREQQAHSNAPTHPSPSSLTPYWQLETSPLSTSVRIVMRLQRRG